MQDETPISFSDLYEAQIDSVYAYFRRRIAAVNAQDATADTFVVVWRRWQDRPPDDELVPWIYGIARNILANHDRSNRRRSNLRRKLLGSPVSTVMEPADTELAHRSEHDEVLRALAQLSPVERETLRLIEWDGLSREQVAAVFGVSRAAVDQRVSRAYKRMERFIQSPGAATTSEPDQVSVQGRL
jgi:RNA polymerase sigma-70 factor (ECF subfamily)